MEVVKFVIIGYGGMGQYHHKCMKGTEGAQVIAAFDTDPKRQKETADNGLKAYKTENEMWADLDCFDGAIIATPNDSHPYYLEKLLSLNKHIICEKPATITASEFEKVINAAENSKGLLQVHQNRRWDGDFLTAQKIDNEGILGKIYRIESRVMGANGIPGGWRKTQKQGGGMMLDWGVHLIDQACVWQKSAIVRLFTEYSFNAGFEVEDGFSLTLWFENGVEYKIIVDTNSLLSLPRWMLYGENGTAQINDWKVSGSIAVKKSSKDKPVGIKAGNGFTKTMAQRPDSAIEYFDLPRVETDSKVFYKMFLSAVTTGTAASIKNNEVLRVLNIMQAAQLSASKNKVIERENYKEIN